MLQISSNDFHQWREAKIDGHVFKVRRPGAGDQLDLSRFGSELVRSGKEAYNLRNQAEAIKDLDPEDKDTLTETMKKFDKVIQPIQEAQENLEKTYLRLFDDGTKKQEKSKKLLKNVGTDGLIEIINRVFEE